MNFIKRNAPIFIIGALTLIIFLIIIAASQKNPPSRPELIQIPEEELIEPHTYIKGDEDATVTLVEFSDFGCPACKTFNPIVNSILQEFPNDVRLAYRHFPLPQHKNADKAAAAAQAAGEQGKFWEYADILFDNQNRFEETDLLEYAKVLGLDMDKFTKDIESGDFETIVNQDVRYGQTIGIDSTPTFFLNGTQMQITDLNSFRDQIINSIETEGQLLPDDLTESVNETTVSYKTNIEAYDKAYPPLVVKYTGNGFEPKNVQAKEGQLLTWVNETGNTIQLQQVIKKFDALKEPVAIAPGTSFELRLTDSKLWNYNVVGTMHYGSVFIYARTVQPQ